MRGIDGEVYKNACEAKRAGIPIQQRGEWSNTLAPPEQDITIETDDESEEGSLPEYE